VEEIGRALLVYSMALAFAYPIARICSSAFFKSKLEYQNQFIRQLNGNKTSGDIVNGT
jgi:hypothetical protein